MCGTNVPRAVLRVKLTRAGYSLLALCSRLISRDFRRDAFFLWIAPFCAALSRATTATRTAFSTSPPSSESTISRARLTNVLAFVRSGMLRLRLLSATRPRFFAGQFFRPSLYFAVSLASTGEGAPPSDVTTVVSFGRAWSGVGPGHTDYSLDPPQALRTVGSTGRYRLCRPSAR